MELKTRSSASTPGVSLKQNDSTIVTKNSLRRVNAQRLTQTYLILIDGILTRFEHITEEYEMAEKEKTYKCLNPVGIREAVDTYPLAPRLDTLGKEIWFSICGEPDITIPLEKKLKMDYPDVNWKIKKTYSYDPLRLSDEEIKTAQGLIQAVCW